MRIGRISLQVFVFVFMQSSDFLSSSCPDQLTFCFVLLVFFLLSWKPPLSGKDLEMIGCCFLFAVSSSHVCRDDDDADIDDDDNDEDENHDDDNRQISSTWTPALAGVSIFVPILCLFELILIWANLSDFITTLRAELSPMTAGSFQQTSANFSFWTEGQLAISRTSSAT